MSHPSLYSRTISPYTRALRPLWADFAALGAILDDLADSPTQPRFEVDETDAAYTFTIALPGFKKADVEVEVKDATLSVVAGNRGAFLNVWTQSSPGGLPRSKAATVSRSITLPSDADTARVEAKLEDGILTCTIPKVPAATARKVTVA